MHTLTGLFQEIANAIRSKTGSAAAITADDFPNEISRIPSPSGIKNITENGVYDVRAFVHANVNIDINTLLKKVNVTTFISTLTQKQYISQIVATFFDGKGGAIIADQDVPKEDYALVTAFGGTSGTSTAHLAGVRYRTTGGFQTYSGSGTAISLYPVYGTKYKLFLAEV